MLFVYDLHSAVDVPRGRLRALVSAQRHMKCNTVTHIMTGADSAPHPTLPINVGHPASGRSYLPFAKGARMLHGSLFGSLDLNYLGNGRLSIGPDPQQLKGPGRLGRAAVSFGFLMVSKKKDPWVSLVAPSHPLSLLAF